jgi:hypothetical protein
MIGLILEIVSMLSFLSAMAVWAGVICGVL